MFKIYRNNVFDSAYVIGVMAWSPLAMAALIFILVSVVAFLCVWQVRIIMDIRNNLTYFLSYVCYTSIGQRQRPTTDYVLLIFWSREDYLAYSRADHCNFNR